MKFKLLKADLIGALDIVSIVPPRPITPQGGAGYLFRVQGDRCFIYSCDKLHDTRVDVGVESSEGIPEEGAQFIFPSDKIGSIAYHRGDWIEIEAGHDDEDDRYWVRYQTELGAEAEWNTYNPGLIQPFDDALDAAKDTEHTFRSVTIQEAISMAKPYLAKPNDSRVEKNFHSMQIFDDSKPEWAKGDGNLFAADGIRACWVEVDDFKGKGLSLHGQHLPFVTAFLAKAEGDIRVRQGETKIYAITKHGNSGQRVLGWARHVKLYEKFNRYPEKLDTHILRADKEQLVMALRGVRAALDKRRDKIRVIYQHTTKETDRPSLKFQLSEGAGRGVSDLVDVEIVDDGVAGAKATTDNFEINANVDQLLGLVEPLRGHQLALRVAIIPPTEKRPREVKYFRTIEEFWLSPAGKVLAGAEDGAHKCVVTRFTPAKD
jgi:hypothetical protein